MGDCGAHSLMAIAGTRLGEGKPDSRAALRDRVRPATTDWVVTVESG